MKEIKGAANYISRIVDIIFYILIIAAIVLAVLLILGKIDWPGVPDLIKGGGETVWRSPDPNHAPRDPEMAEHWYMNTENGLVQVTGPGYSPAEAAGHSGGK